MKMSNLWDFNGDLMTYSDIKTLVQATGVKIVIETGIGSGILRSDSLSFSIGFIL